MANRIGLFSLTSLALAGLGMVAMPVCARAQDTGADQATNDQLNKPINLDVRSANLYYALTLMFDQLKVGNYTIPEQLKQMEVSAHFTALPLRTALETLLKNSGYTYKVDGGVYSVVPKAVDTPEAPVDKPTDVDTTIKGKKIYRLTSNQIIFNSVDIVTRIGGRVLPSSVGSQNGQQGGGLGGFGGGGLGGGGLGGGLGGGRGGGGGGGVGGGGGGGVGGGGMGGGGGGGGGFGGGGFGGGGGGFGGGGGGGRRGGGGF